VPELNEEIGFLPGHGWVFLKAKERCPETSAASHSDKCIEAVGNFLQNLAPWDVFFTGTWSRPVTFDGVLYGTRRFLAEMQKRAGVPLYAFFGVERGERGHLLHIHSLMGNVAHLKPYCGERLAPDVRGRPCCVTHAWPWGYARALTYDPALGAARYVSKYVTKQLSEWDLVGFPATPQSALKLGNRK